MFYTREIMKGLDDANQVIIDKLPHGMEMDPTSYFSLGDFRVGAFPGWGSFASRSTAAVIAGVI